MVGQADQWYYRIVGEEFGPVSFGAIARMAREGNLSPDDDVRAAPEDEWERADSFPELSARFPRPNQLDGPVENTLAEITTAVSPSEPSPDEGRDDNEYFVNEMGQERGPMRFPELRKSALLGTLSPTDFVRVGRDGPRVAARRVEGLFAPQSEAAGDADDESSEFQADDTNLDSCTSEIEPPEPPTADERSSGPRDVATEPVASAPPEAQVTAKPVEPDKSTESHAAPAPVGRQPASALSGLDRRPNEPPRQAGKGSKQTVHVGAAKRSRSSSLALGSFFEFASLRTVLTSTPVIALCCLVVLAVVLKLVWSGNRGVEGLELGTVTGIVSLDGEPLAKALVTFEPEDGRISTGATDEEGRYELQYTRGLKGAKVGHHTVRINVPAPWNPSEQDAKIFAFGPSAADSASGAKPLPARYNTKTTLSADVEAEPNTIDFPLTST